MTGQKTPRVEFSPDSIKVVFTEFTQLLRTHNDGNLFHYEAKQSNLFSEDEQKLLRSMYSVLGHETRTVLVGSAYHMNSNSDKLDIYPTRENLTYTKQTITEREPTDEEKQYYEDSFSSCSSPIYEFTLPPLEKFFDPCNNDEFTTAISTEDELIATAMELMDTIEFGKWLKIKSSFTGSPDTLPSEWDPQDDMNNKKAIREAARQKYYTSKDLWHNILHITYHDWFDAKLERLQRKELELDSAEIIAFELVDEAEDESYCKMCGQIDLEDEFLQVDDSVGQTHQVCDACAERNAKFTEEAIDKAKRHRSWCSEGQQRLDADYSTSP